MVTIGLAGGSGSGKGYVCKQLLAEGIPSFDSDAVYHEMISMDSEVTRELICAFGPAIGLPSGGIDRAALRDIVFAEGAKAKRERLNEITHRHVRIACLAWLSEMREKGCSAAVIDAPLLFESGFDELCDLKVSVIAGEEIRINRIMLRDGIPRDAAILRMSLQMTERELQSRSDFVIVNDGDSEALCAQIRQLMNMIRSI